MKNKLTAMTPVHQSVILIYYYQLHIFGDFLITLMFCTVLQVHGFNCHISHLGLT